MIAGAVLLAAQTTVILMFSILLGMKSVTGIAGLLAVIGFATLLGVGFSGLMVGVALLTGNGAATSGISFLFFPLTFLTATFVPVEQLDGWLEVAARINPITYILEATRAIINTGWESDLIAQGLISSLSIFVVLFGFALYGLRVRTRRR
jgi:ABC-2 type transport system permease protein